MASFDSLWDPKHYSHFCRFASLSHRREISSRGTDHYGLLSILYDCWYLCWWRVWVDEVLARSQDSLRREAMYPREILGRKLQGKLTAPHSVCLPLRLRKPPFVMSLSSSCKLALHEPLQLWLSGLSSLRDETKREQTPGFIRPKPTLTFSIRRQASLLTSDSYLRINM